MIKLGIYVAFFFMLLRFYGLPIHIMRDLFMTSRDFIKRLNALLRYRRAIQEMNRYPDATADELSQENTCIICREEMRPWDPVNHPGAIDRIRPKKLPCGHVLHLGCLKSWLERQQVCPTCRSPVTMDRGRGGHNRAAGLRIQIGAAPQLPGGQQQPGGNNNAPLGQQGPIDGPAPPPREGGPRVFNLGPIRLGFGANGHQARDLAQQFGIPQGDGNQAEHGHLTPTPTQNQQPAGDNIQQIGNLLVQTENIVQRELQNLQVAQQELQVAHLLVAELQRLRQRRQQPQDHYLRGQPSLMSMGNGPAPAATVQNQNIHMAAPGHYPQFPLGTTFPAIPPRIGSPFMVRHGAPLNGAAIPAGSPELPDGVTLPPGWSLIPLQRLDGTHPPAYPSSQAVASSPNGDASSSAQAAGRTGAPLATEAVPDEISATRVTNSTASVHLTSESTSRETADSSSQTARPTPVVAPSPLMPNWGGSAQLFNSRSRSDVAENPARSSSPSLDSESRTIETRNRESQQPAANESVREELPHREEIGSNRVEGADDSTDKGKARAATVEEAEEEDEE